MLGHWILAVIPALILVSGSVIAESDWQDKQQMFLERFSEILTLETIPILGASSYKPDEWYKLIQDDVPDSKEFPCHEKEDKPMLRSEERPKSVHKLRPGDIDVVAALGDSLSAGSAAREVSTLGVFVQDRGLSFVGGGEKTWRKFFTVPNVLKEFNPNLKGFATGRGPFYAGNATFNVAIPGSTHEDILLQMQAFILKLSNQEGVDARNDWKLINIFTGHNDLCSYQCFEPKNHSAEMHKHHLKQAIDFLLESGIPRVYVNLISVLDPMVHARYPSNQPCDIFRKVACPCLYVENKIEENSMKIAKIAREYQQVEKELASDPLYKTRDDFTIVWQPFFTAMNTKENVDESEKSNFSKVFTTDYPVWAADCFHFNQRGHALVARMLWNNMLEPVGKKSNDIASFASDDLKCPTKEHPYLFTEKNSGPI